MGVDAPAADTAPVISPNTRSIVEAVIVIFLLLFAILAFGWFYLQRAKARTPATDAAAPATADAAPAAPEAPAAPAEADTAAATATDKPAS